MFGKKIKIFRLFGFNVSLDTSWFIIGVLICWSLASGVFPAMYKGLDTSTYWLMGLGGALGLFFSIVFHEFCHSLVARRFGLPMKGITLFIFGGIAEMSDEPPSPKAEFFMAVAGPVASIFIGILFLALAMVLRITGVHVAFTGAVHYLGFINLILAGFNLLPGFPLDGGRILRSVIWHWRGDFRLASRISASIGSGFGIVLIIFGVVNLIGGQVIGGIWYCLIGMFLRGAASSSYRQVLIRQTLGGREVAAFMTRDPEVVQPEVTLETLVEDHVYRHHHKLFPVLEGDRLLGFVNMQHIKSVPREKWSSTKVCDVMRKTSKDNTLSPDTDAMEALKRMNRTQTSRFMVARNDRLEGVVTLKDFLEFFSMKTELENMEYG